jgi:hypothetical protein
MKNLEIGKKKVTSNIAGHKLNIQMSNVFLDIICQRLDEIFSKYHLQQQ